MLVVKNLSALGKNKIYFCSLLIALLLCVPALLVYGKEAAFIPLHSYHPFYLNVFFINYTFTGDGIFALCLIALIFFYFKRKQFGFTLLYSFLISGITTQLIKNLANPSNPKFYFESGTYLNFTNDFIVGSSSGFSGHTATAFAIATVMALMFKNKNLQLLILMGAILVAYSRIYLAQHFLLDVMAGALLGSVSGLLGFYLAQNRISIKRSIKKMHRVSPGSLSSPGAIQTV